MYSQVADTSKTRPECEPETDKSKMYKEKEKYEVLLVKPENEKNKRCNEEIRTQVTNSLNSVRSQLKIKGIRHIRIVMEIKAKKDVEIIRKIKLENIDIK